MSEMRQVPGARSGNQPRSTEDTAASTQMFRAFVEQGGDPDGRSRTGLIVAAGGLLLAALAVIVVLFLV